MDSKQANALPLTQVLERMGATPARQTEREAWYLSPLRQEQTASFHIHRAANVWYDFGEGKGGTVIDLVCAYLQIRGEAAGVADALRWLRPKFGHPNDEPTAPRFPPAVEREPAWTLKRVKTIMHVALQHYVAQRGIPLELAQRYLKEIHAVHSSTGKNMFALGLRNEEMGYEVRNPFFKGTVGAKGISFIRGAVIKPPAIHVFEGMMDFLSAVAETGAPQFDGDTIVLNSVSCLPAALPYIRGYGYRTLHSWLDHDRAGQQATQTLAEFARLEEGLTHQPMNALYAPHRDVNTWRMDKLGLPPLPDRPAPS